MRHTPANGPSQRQLRVGEELRHALAAILMRDELHDPDLAGVSITVSEVRPSPDMKHATVFVTTLNGAGMDTVLPALRRAAPFLRGQVARAVRLRYTPQLKKAAVTTKKLKANASPRFRSSRNIVATGSCCARPIAAGATTPTVRIRASDRTRRRDWGIGTSLDSAMRHSSASLRRPTSTTPRIRRR